MVQTMLRNDPRFANNPMLQNMMQEIATNPQVAAQLSQMMSDPSVLNQIDQMRSMQSGQQPTLPTDSTGTNNDPESMMRMAQMMQMMQQPNGAAPIPGFIPPPNINQGQPSGNGSNDADQTEEEMIAEAIRRSLQDS